MEQQIADVQHFLTFECSSLGFLLLFSFFSSLGVFLVVFVGFIL